MGKRIKVNLKNGTFQVSGDFALMRTGRIDCSVEKSTRSLLGTLTSGEGLLQTIWGEGSVWPAPIQAIYQQSQVSGRSIQGAVTWGSSTRA